MSVTEADCNVVTPIQRLTEHCMPSAEVCGGHELGRTTIDGRDIDPIACLSGRTPGGDIRFLSVIEADCNVVTPTQRLPEHRLSLIHI